MFGGGQAADRRSHEHIDHVPVRVADQEAASFNDALARILGACEKHGVEPGIAGNQNTAPKRVEQGFRLVEAAAYAAVLATAVGQALRAVDPTRAPESKTSYL